MDNLHIGCCPHVTRRGFLGGVGMVIGGSALGHLSWPALAAGLDEMAPGRAPLVVKPILVYEVPQRRPQTSWRSWGGIQTEEQAREEVARIQTELTQVERKADFPIRFLPVSHLKKSEELEGLQNDMAACQAMIVYGAGGSKAVYDKIGQSGKDVVLFVRHKSGPVYLWYEIISPRYLRQHQDRLAVAGIDFDDVVVDNQEELLWRLRALCGLHNTKGSRIVAIGGAGAWAQPEGVVPDLVRRLWKLDIQEVTYPELGRLIEQARGDQAAVQRARQRASEYLRLPGTRLETRKEFVENAFLLEDVFMGLMKRAESRAITVNSCMGTIMPIAQTTACLVLSLLNDAGYLAFCESDFVVIPSGLLLGNISGKPVFLNDPAYPHDGLITLAHCTAPRKNDGKTLDPARIMTHFESDYGAAPKVAMKIGQVVTNIIPDFKSERWVGLLAEVVENPDMDVCRSQIDVRFACDSGLVARNMPGFHWMTGYGDYSRELGYTLKKVPIKWELLD
ncbi:MAG: sugar isomerase [Acidobacteriota bacterium]